MTWKEENLQIFLPTECIIDCIHISGKLRPDDKTNFTRRNFKNIARDTWVNNEHTHTASLAEHCTCYLVK